MLSDVFDLIEVQITGLRPDINLPTSTTFLVPLILLNLLIVAWCLWRLWAFTIMPIIWPDEPLMLPYTIPWIGHALWFMKDDQGLMKYGNKYFEGDGPFALILGGNRFVAIRSPSDTRAVWNNTKTLTFDEHLKGVIKAIGLPEERYKLLFKTNPAELWKGDEKDAPFFVKENPAKKRYVSLQENLFKEQLLRGEKMNALSKDLMLYVDKSITDYLSNKNCFPAKGGGVVVDLNHWGRECLATGASMAMLGVELFQREPGFTLDYMEWEDLSWKIALQHPPSDSEDIRNRGQHLIKVITKYYALDPSKRPRLSWWFERMRSEQLALGLTEDDVATFALLMLWGVNLNTYRMLFWTMAHILSSPSLTAKVIEETAGAFTSESDRPSITHLMKECPTLTAIWLEVLRHYASSATIRSVTAPTIVGGKKVKPGDHVFGPFRLTHFSTSIFGDDADDFNHERWLKDEKLQNVKGFNPFGGGHMQCPGRTLAKQEVFLFVARVLNKYDIEPTNLLSEKEMVLVNGEMRWKVPEPSWEHVLATLEPQKGKDGDGFMVRVREKSQQYDKSLPSDESLQSEEESPL